MEEELVNLKSKQGSRNDSGDSIEDSPSDSLVVSVDNDAKVPDDDDRGHWGNKFEFFLAIVGYTVGVGSFWRFPIICSRNGGGAFLIPFYFLLITSGGPLYYLEVCLGQFSGQSAGLAFGFCPLLKGLGLLQVTLSFTVLWYLILICVWVYYYLYSSFSAQLPWATCDNTWNTHSCRVYDETLTRAGGSNLTTYNMTSYTNVTLNVTGGKFQSAAFEFWEYQVIGRSSGLEDMGHLQPHAVICMLIAWTLTVLAVINGAKTLGKVVYVTATAPFLFLIIMFIRGITLDGAMDGILFYLKPDFSKLLTTQMWLEAGIQVFYSLGPTWGGVITMASYNKFHQKTFWSSTGCVMISGFSSFFNGLVVFTILGFMAKDAGLTVQEVATQSGPGLTFVVFPIALSKMPFPQLWSVLFFLMLTTVVFDSIFGTLETIICGIIDFFPKYLTSKRSLVNIAVGAFMAITGLPLCLNFGMLETITSGIIDFFPKYLTSKRIIVNIAVGVFMAVTGLPLCLNSGIYVFQLADWYFSQFALLFGSFFECVAVCWIYGTDRFARDIALMTGRKVSPLLRIMWSTVIPVFVSITFFLMLSRYSTPAYGDGYVYSSTAIIVGIAVGLIPNIATIVVAIRAMVKAKGSFVERFNACSVPDKSWQPNDREARELYKMKPYVYSDSFKERIRLNLFGPDYNYDL